MNLNEVVTVNHLEKFKAELIEEIKVLLELKNKTLDRKMLRTNETLELLNISKGTLQNLRNSGKISYKKLGGIIYYNVDDINNKTLL